MAPPIMPPTAPLIHIGTAGWGLPKGVEEHRGTGTQLERYARLFNAVEINSTFYRPHRPATFARWAASVPDHFRFAVKLARALTHEHRLRGSPSDIRVFLDMIAPLGDKLGPVLIQLPPSLAFDGHAEDFLTAFRELFAGDIVLEPRHGSWGAPEVEQLLLRLRVARVAADPPRIGDRLAPGGHRSLTYFRLHGSPRVYWSNYEEAWLRTFASTVHAAARRAPTWVIFDNTAAGAAAHNALQLMERLAHAGADAA